MTAAAIHGRRHFLKGLSASAACCALAAGCSTNPATGRTTFTGLYDREDEIEIGREEAPKLIKEFGGPYEDRRLQSYVDSIGRDLARTSEMPDLPYEFHLLNSPVVNAFALPGGQVFITRGLMALAANEAEVAGVIAHEIGHVTAQHTVDRLTRSQLATVGLLALGIGLGSRAVADAASYGAQVYLAGFSQSQELEADTLGVRYMSRAGYDPDAMATFLSTLRAHSQVEAQIMGLPPGSVDQANIMATHPRTLDRVQQARALADTQRPPNPRIGRDGYFQQINGMLFGDDPSQGLIFGQRFVHPELRIEFEVPDAFVLRNSRNKVLAAGPDDMAIVFDAGKMQRTSAPAAYIRDEWAPGLDLQGLEGIEVNGLAAATAAARIRMQNGLRDVRLVAIQVDEAALYRFVFITPPERTSGMSEAFRRTTYSFRRISQAEAAKAKPLRLLTVPVRPDDSIAALANNMPYGRFNEALFRVLNDLEGGEPLPRSGLIKVVAS